MIDDSVLLNDWYIVAAASELKEEALLAARLWDEDLVLWRNAGAVMAL
jgi:phenylpropionate dioxygenase-like ring-hydroxylating dioxygenase large terminal subunit